MFSLDVFTPCDDYEKTISPAKMTAPSSPLKISLTLAALKMTDFWNFPTVNSAELDFSRKLTLNLSGTVQNAIPAVAPVWDLVVHGALYDRFRT